MECCFGSWAAVAPGPAVPAGAPVLTWWDRWWGFGCGEGCQASVGGGDPVSLGPGAIDVQELASSGAYQASGDGQDA